MMERVVVPEILDGLDPSDPAAVASRRDLRRINFLMGSERWILAEVGRRRSLAAGGIVELGAGEGRLAGRLGRLGPTTAIDLAPCPEALVGRVEWRRGDLFEVWEWSGKVLVANLFLHHFEADGLERIGSIASDFELLVFAEPLRTAGSLGLGRVLSPFVHPVTRHDMPASIRAGFVPGELAGLLGLEPDRWRISERCTWRGGLRVLASRR